MTEIPNAPQPGEPQGADALLASVFGSEAALDAAFPAPSALAGGERMPEQVRAYFAELTGVPASMVEDYLRFQVAQHGPVVVMSALVATDLVNQGVPEEQANMIAMGFTVAKMMDWQRPDRDE